MRLLVLLLTYAKYGNVGIDDDDDAMLQQVPKRKLQLSH